MRPIVWKTALGRIAFVALAVMIACISSLLLWNHLSREVVVFNGVDGHELSSHLEEFHESSNFPLEFDSYSAVVSSHFYLRGKLGLYCGDPLVFLPLTEECLDLLGEYFLDKPFVWKSIDWFSLEMNYERIFVENELDKLKVLDALNRPECRLEKGEIRWDLKDSCHAESFANIANFIYICQLQLPSVKKSLLNAETPSRISIYDAYKDWGPEYMIESSWAGEEILEGRWLLQRMCPELSDSSIFERSTYGEYYDILKTIAERLRLIPQSHGLQVDTFLAELGIKPQFVERDLFDVLRALAARLGDSWASSTYSSHADDKVWEQHEATVMPWKEYLEYMRLSLNDKLTRSDQENWPRVRNEYVNALPKIKAFGKSLLKSGTESRTGVLAFSLGAWIKLEEAGLSVDVDKLVVHVCNSNWKYATENCQQAIENLRSSDDSTNQQFWHLLARFEARAIQLNLYDVDAEERHLDWEQQQLRITVATEIEK